MSRTYRKPTPWDLQTRKCTWRCSHEDCEVHPLLKCSEVRRRDEKPWYKPPKWFKKMMRRQFRAKCKDAWVKGREFPVDKKSDIWNWT